MGYVKLSVLCLILIKRNDVFFHLAFFFMLTFLARIDGCWYIVIYLKEVMGGWDYFPLVWYFKTEQLLKNYFYVYLQEKNDEVRKSLERKC